VERTPEDARKLKRPEQSRLLEQMEGRWNVEVLSGQPTGPNIMCLCDKGEFTHATIQGNTLTGLYGTWLVCPNRLILSFFILQAFSVFIFPNSNFPSCIILNCGFAKMCEFIINKQTTFHI